MFGVTRALLQAELIVCRRQTQHELNGVLGLPSRWAHGRADLLIDRLDWLDWLGSEFERDHPELRVWFGDLPLDYGENR